MAGGATGVAGISERSAGMDLDLRGRTAFITGASGGIGWAIAQAFAGEGARLVLHAHRNGTQLRERLAREGAAWNALVVEADVADPDAVRAAFDQGARRHGRVDVCVANAGVWEAESLPLDEMPVARIRETLAVNLLGALWTARAFMGHLRGTAPAARGAGASLIFIGSTAGRFGERGHCDYAVSKAGLYGLLRTLKNEIVLIDPAARVNLVEPGWTLTPMASDTLAGTGTLERVARTMPLRRIAQPHDIAAAVLFLSSPAAARHISGEVLTVAGGMEGRVLWEPGDPGAPISSPPQ
jgi:3-oxoacyl-[acyl-carrier protein] reductase